MPPPPPHTYTPPLVGASVSSKFDILFARVMTKSLFKVFFLNVWKYINCHNYTQIIKLTHEKFKTKKIKYFWYLPIICSISHLYKVLIS